MIQPTESACELSEAGLTMARHRLRALLVKPAGRPRSCDKRPFTILLHCLCVILYFFLIFLKPELLPWAAADKTSPPAEQLRNGRSAITLPFFSSPAGPASAARPEAAK